MYDFYCQLLKTRPEMELLVTLLPLGLYWNGKYIEKICDLANILDLNHINSGVTGLIVPKEIIPICH